MSISVQNTNFCQKTFIKFNEASKPNEFNEVSKPEDIFSDLMWKCIEEADWESKESENLRFTYHVFKINKDFFNASAIDSFVCDTLFHYDEEYLQKVYCKALENLNSNSILFLKGILFDENTILHGWQIPKEIIKMVMLIPTLKLQDLLQSSKNAYKKYQLYQ